MWYKAVLVVLLVVLLIQACVIKGQVVDATFTIGVAKIVVVGHACYTDVLGPQCQTFIDTTDSNGNYTFTFAPFIDSTKFSWKAISRLSYTVYNDSNPFHADSVGTGDSVTIILPLVDWPVPTYSGYLFVLRSPVFSGYIRDVHNVPIANVSIKYHFMVKPPSDIFVTTDNTGYYVLPSEVFYSSWYWKPIMPNYKFTPDSVVLGLAPILHDSTFNFVGKDTVTVGNKFLKVPSNVVKPKAITAAYNLLGQRLLTTNDRKTRIEIVTMPGNTMLRKVLAY